MFISSFPLFPLFSSLDKTIKLYYDYSEVSELTKEEFITESIKQYEYMNSKKDSIINQWKSYEGRKMQNNDILEFSYDIKVLSIDDDIITAKITNTFLPYVKPRIGDLIKFKK